MELTGKKLTGDHYYRVKVDAPMSEEVPAYIAECSDIIEALNMTFNEGEAFKAIWRMAAARQGRGKPGNKAQYDADKAAHYAARLAVQAKREVEQKIAKEFAFPTAAPAPDTTPSARPVEIMTAPGRRAFLTGQEADDFLLSVNRLRPGETLAIEGQRVTSWRYELDMYWKPL